ncbi:MAG: hypothetical protein L0332_27045 [Chloroflexi bacterium]|nr:hypothetical protein [Chloroflexota bacterium]MCI0580058.1 hypothetical protein [Chloroflexota bacterium]MCI0649638.1 hypothetical protein [Chloroflexota bacterium]MCI0730356.1 hypothetical protein [Chloroflexota bacterium]
MKEQIARWFAWLQSATSKEEERLARVYSDGRQLWASDGYSLHALDVATEKNGRVTVSEDGTLQVDEIGDIPSFATTMPQGEPIASVVISAARLKQAAEGQEGLVRLNLYGSGQALELSSAGKYALVMPVTEVEEWWFWRPGSEVT